MNILSMQSSLFSRFVACVAECPIGRRTVIDSDVGSRVVSWASVVAEAFRLSSGVLELVGNLLGVSF